MSKRSLTMLTVAGTALALLAVILLLAVGWGPLQNMMTACARWLAGLVRQ